MDFSKVTDRELAILVNLLEGSMEWADRLLKVEVLAEISKRSGSVVRYAVCKNIYQGS